MSDKLLNPDGSRYVALSIKSLAKIKSWCDANETEHLVVAYQHACRVLGEYLDGDVYCFYRAGLDLRYREVVYDGLYVLRDYVGRQILKRIKSEAATAAKGSGA